MADTYLSQNPATPVRNVSDYAIVDVATDATTVSATPVYLYGVYVNTVLSAHTCLITDGTTTVITLVASLAAGTMLTFPGIRMKQLVVDPNDAATGNLTLFYSPQ